jgi:hypothetical protein
MSVLKRVIFGFIISILSVGLIVTFVGFEQVIDSLSRADSRYLILALLMIFGWILCWSTVFYIFTRRLSLGFGFVGSTLTYTTVLMANAVTPFGQAGGEPVAAAFVKNVADKEYEECLAIISVVDILNFTPAIVLFSISSLLIQLNNNLGQLFQKVTLLFASVTVVVLVSLGLIYTNRDKVESGIVGSLSYINNKLKQIPVIPTTDNQQIEDSVSEFRENLSKIISSPSDIIIPALFSILGMAFQSIALLFSLKSLGLDVPISSVLFAVPVAGLASVLPLPGGSGGIESVMIIILHVYTSPVEDITAGVVIMRSGVFWIPIVVACSYILYMSVTDMDK